MNKFKIILSSFLLSFLFSTNSFSQEEQSVFEEVIVTAEKKEMKAFETYHKLLPQSLIMKLKQKISHHL